MPMLSDDKIKRIKAKDLSGFSEDDRFLRDQEGFTILYHVIEARDPKFLKEAVSKLKLSAYIYYGDPVPVTVGTEVITNAEVVRIRPDVQPRCKTVTSKYTILHGPIDHVVSLLNDTLYARSRAAVEKQAEYKEQTENLLDILISLLSQSLQVDEAYFEMLVANAIQQASQVYSSDKELNKVAGSFTSILCGIDALDILKGKHNSYLAHARETGGYEKDASGERKPLLGFVPWYFFPLRIFFTLRILIDVHLGKESDDKLPAHLKAKHHNDIKKVRQELVQKLLQELRGLLSSYWLTRTAYYNETIFKDQKLAVHVGSPLTNKLQQEIDELDAERKRLNTELNNLAGNLRTLNHQLKIARLSAKKRNTKLEEALAKVSAKESEVAVLEVELAKKRSEFDLVISQLASKKAELKKLTEESESPHIISMVNGLIERLKSLKDDESTVIYLAWQGHALYLQIHKDNGQWNLLVHNLGDLNDWHDKDPKEKTCFPYKLGKLDEKAWDKGEAGYRYLLEVLKTLYPLQSSKLARPVYYDRYSDPAKKLLTGPYVHELDKLYAASPEQIEENCVYANHEATRIVSFQGYSDDIRKKEKGIGGALELKDIPTLDLQATLESLAETGITKIPEITTSGQNTASVIVNLKEQLRTVYKVNFSSLPPLFKDDEDDAKQGAALSMEDFFLELELSSYDGTDVLDKVSLEDLMVHGKEQLFIGQLGVGKSTLMRNIAYRWATEPAFANDFDYIILMPLKKLRHIDIKGGTIEEQVCDCLWKVLFKFNDVDDALRAQLAAKIFDKKAKVRWLLDGYDEVYTNLDPKAQAVLDYLRKQDYVFTTTRPVALKKEDYAKPHVLIKGLGDEDIEDWVNEYKDLFVAEKGQALSSKQKEQADEKAKSLLVFLHKPRIWGLVHIPIHLRMVCEAAISGDMDFSADSSIDSHTKLYEVFVKALAKRYFHKGTEEDGSIAVRYTAETYWAELEPALYQIAFDILDKREQEIATGVKLEEIIRASEPLFKSNYDRNWVKEIIRCGVLQNAEDAGSGVTKEFLHSSYGEYFAAKHIVSRIKNNFEEFKAWFVKNKNELRYQEVWGFVSGLIETEELANRWFELWLGDLSELSLESLNAALSDKIIEYIAESAFHPKLAFRDKLAECISDYKIKGASLSDLPANIINIMQVCKLWEHPRAKAWAEQALNIELDLSSIDKAVELLGSLYASDPAKLSPILNSLKKQDLNLRGLSNKGLTKVFNKEEANAKKHEQRFLTAITLLRIQLNDDVIMGQVQDCLIWCKQQNNIELLSAAINALRTEKIELYNNIESDFLKVTQTNASSYATKKKLIQAIEILSEICADKDKVFTYIVKKYLYSEEASFSALAMKALSKLDFTKNELITRLSSLRFIKGTKEPPVLQFIQLLLNHATEEALPHLVNTLEKLVFSSLTPIIAGEAQAKLWFIQEDVLNKLYQIMDKAKIYSTLAIVELLAKHNVTELEFKRKLFAIIKEKSAGLKLRDAAINALVAHIDESWVLENLIFILYEVGVKIIESSDLQRVGITKVREDGYDRDISNVLTEKIADYNFFMPKVLDHLENRQYDEPIWPSLLRLPYEFNKPASSEEVKASIRESRKKLDIRLKSMVDSIEVDSERLCRLIVKDKSFVVKGKKEVQFWMKKFPGSMPSVDALSSASEARGSGTPMDLDDNASDSSQLSKVTGSKRKADEILVRQAALEEGSNLAPKSLSSHAFFFADPFAFEEVGSSPDRSSFAPPVHSNKKQKFDSASQNKLGAIYGYPSFLQRLADEYGMNRQKVKGDGNCQFTAIAVQLQKKDPAKFLSLRNQQQKLDGELEDAVLVARRLRALTVEHIKANPKEYEELLSAEIGLRGVNPAQDRNYKDVNEYCNVMSQDMIFGDAFTLKAVSEALGLNIILLDSALFKEESSLKHKIYQGDIAKPLVAKESLLITYNGSDHYDAIENEPNAKFEKLVTTLKSKDSESVASAASAAASSSGVDSAQLGFTI
ncbi:MAG: putative NTPase [Gammaproteobacteria bacterium]|jgi:hypothetical protein|nr:putative NTPase [Gammaproteobacteria bacterium]